jgi:hypothetical protein
VVCGLAFVLYDDIARKEASGGSFRAHVLIIAAYELLGKNGVFWLLMLGGAATIVAAAAQLLGKLRRF